MIRAVRRSALSASGLARRAAAATSASPIATVTRPAPSRVEMLPWDVWGAQPAPDQSLDEAQIDFCDELAELTLIPMPRSRPCAPHTGTMSGWAYLPPCSPRFAGPAGRRQRRGAQEAASGRVRAAGPLPARRPGTRSPPEELKQSAAHQRAERGPTTKLLTHTEIATVRCSGSRNRVRISARVEGARVAPATPSSARAAISISALVENAASIDATEGGRTDQQQPATADQIAHRPHREQKPGDHEPVEVDDPQQLRAARLQVGAHLRQR